MVWWMSGVVDVCVVDVVQSTSSFAPFANAFLNDIAEYDIEITLSLTMANDHIGVACIVACIKVRKRAFSAKFFIFC